METQPRHLWRSPWLIWLFAFGYFAAYVPYSAFTKAMTKGLVGPVAVDGLLLLPASLAATVVTTLLVLSLLRWWRFARHVTVLGVRLPFPRGRTALSGLFTGLIIATTTLSYTDPKVSIVFAMLLMRGGVLILSPIVDAITGRHVRWFSWLGLFFSLGAVFLAFAEPPEPGKGRFELNWFLFVDVFVYLASYFFRLQFMSRLAKSDDPDATRGFIVEEQLVAAPAVLLTLLAVALIDHGMAATSSSALFPALYEGFISFWTHPSMPWALLVGFCSTFTGLFGALVLLDRSENAFAVPVNRSSSVLAGIAASLVLWAALGLSLPSGFQFAGAGLIIAAIVFLAVAPQFKKAGATGRSS